MDPAPRARLPREVWAWNFDAEFDELLNAVAREPAPVLALDTEFPGFLREDRPRAAPSVRYRTLRANVDSLRPIQLGIAVGGANGSRRGAWTFNLWFDLSKEWYTTQSIAFLHAAGVDFPRHAVEGLNPDVLAWRLTTSPLLGCNRISAIPEWVTFSGWYDWGYLLKLVTGRPLPSQLIDFDRQLDALCPQRHELQETLPCGSLDSLCKTHGVMRRGLAHTAGSDALATLELFYRVVGRGGGAAAPVRRLPPAGVATGGADMCAGWAGQAFGGGAAAVREGPSDAELRAALACCLLPPARRAAAIAAAEAAAASVGAMASRSAARHATSVAAQERSKDQDDQDTSQPGTATDAASTTLPGDSAASGSSATSSAPSSAGALSGEEPPPVQATPPPEAHEDPAPHEEPEPPDAAPPPPASLLEPLLGVSPTRGGGGVGARAAMSRAEEVGGGTRPRRGVLRNAGLQVMSALSVILICFRFLFFREPRPAECHSP